MQDISAGAANRATFQRGVEYYGQRRVSGLRMEPDHEHGGTRLTALVRGGKRGYEVEVSLNDRGEILEGWCDCPSFYQYDGFCRHIVAALLTYHYIQKAKADPLPGLKEAENTDPYAARMLAQYSRRQLSEAVGRASQRRARLEPVLEYDYRGNFSLGLSVGAERMYVVKDLSKFYEDLRAGSTVEYGSRLTLLHTESAFEESSRPLLQFFLEAFREFKEFHTMYGAPPSRAAKRSLVLSPAAFDRLFGVCAARKAPVRTGIEGQQSLVFRNENPQLELSVEPIGAHSWSVGMGSAPFVYFGEKYAYVMAGESLFRCDEAFTASTRELFWALSEKGGRLSVGEAEMPAFCADVLPLVEPFVTVRAEGCDLTRFEPSPFTAKLYLDMPVPGVVTGRLSFAYGGREFDAFDEENPEGLNRDTRGEAVVRTVTEKYLGACDPGSRLMSLSDEDAVYSLLAEGLGEISAVAEVYTTDSLRRVTVRRPPAMSVGVRLSGSLLELTLDTGGFPREELLAVLDSYRAHKKYHRLRDGSFINLEGSGFESFSELVTGLDLKREEIARGSARVPRYRAMMLDGLTRDSEWIKTDRDAAFKAMLRDLRDVADTDVQPPPEMRQVLRNYQKTGFRWLKTMSRYGFGGILADDMGLGKTLQAIAFLQSLKDEAGDERRPSLVVCPASLVLNWCDEIVRFAPRLRALPVIGSQARRAELAAEIAESDVVVTSYELLKRDAGLYESLRFDCEILDEAQYIKNANTLNSRAVKEIESDCRFALTGTPVENSLAELWSIFDFLMPGYLFSHHRFREMFELPVVRDGDEAAGERLRRMASPFILRRLKSSVLRELPPKTETVLYTGLEGEQQQLYQAGLSSMKAQIASVARGADAGRSRILVLSMLTRLRQICCDPSLCYENYEGESAKLELCMELLETSVGGGHKVLLFSQFTSMLEIIAARLDAAGIRYFVLRGSTPKEERARLVTRFGTDDTPVFLISLRAGGTGLNLTAADIVIHYDPWWNISAQNQATDRAHRIGQHGSVQVYRLIAKDTVEEKILRLQEQKLQLAESVVTEGGGALSPMSAEEMFALFES